MIDSGTALVGSDQPYVLAAVLMTLVVVGLMAERASIGRYLTGATVILIGGTVCSNLGIIPFKSGLYDGIMGYLVPIAIPLLLFKADIRKVISEAGPVAALFLVGAAFSVLGALIAFAVLDVGPEASKVAGTFAATYIGGSMNLVAVSNALAFENLSTVTAALAADNVVGATYLVSISVLSGLKGLERFASSPAEKAVSPAERQSGNADAGAMMRHLALALAASAAICGVAGILAGYMGIPGYAILLITLLAVAVANLWPRRMKLLQGEFELGTLFMYVFFAVIGASTDLSILLEHSVAIIGFAAIVVVTHLLLLLPVARLLGFNLAETLIASNACIAGPATAAAMAASRGWTHLMVPAVMCGVLGYVIANFIGVAIVRLLG